MNGSNSTPHIYSQCSDESSLVVIVIAFILSQQHLIAQSADKHRLGTRAQSAQHRRQIYTSIQKLHIFLMLHSSGHPTSSHRPFTIHTPQQTARFAKTCNVPTTNHRVAPSLEDSQQMLRRVSWTTPPATNDGETRPWKTDFPPAFLSIFVCVCAVAFK